MPFFKKNRAEYFWLDVFETAAASASGEGGADFFEVRRYFNLLFSAICRLIDDCLQHFVIALSCLLGNKLEVRSYAS
jgi:hypothetical protein